MEAATGGGGGGAGGRRLGTPEGGEGTAKEDAERGGGMLVSGKRRAPSRCSQRSTEGGEKGFFKYPSAPQSAMAA
jgi:hypothetical protein